jgi:hypothetical protein
VFLLGAGLCSPIFLFFPSTQHPMTQVLVNEEGNYERIHFVTGFCRQYMTVLLIHNLHSSLMKFGSI